MAPRQLKRNVKEVRQQPLALKRYSKPFHASLATHINRSLIGKRPQGIKKERPQLSSYKSAHLEEITQHQKQPVSNRYTKQKPSNSCSKQACYPPSTMLKANSGQVSIDCVGPFASQRSKTKANARIQRSTHFCSS